MDLLTILAKLIPEGVSVVAVIFVVVLFLRHQDKRDKKLDELSATCHANSKDSQKLFQDQIRTITEDFKEFMKENTLELRQLREHIHGVVR